MHVKVQRRSHNVEVAGALAVAEERSLHAVGAGQQAQFGRRHARAAVIVRMKADYQRVAAFDVPANPLDLVRVNVRHRHLYCVGQVQNHFPLRRGFPYLQHRFADIFGELNFRRAEALG